MSNPRPGSLNDQVIAIAQQATRLRGSLDEKQSAVTINGLKAHENSLAQVSEILIPFQQHYGHLQALAGIGQVVNSTLEVDEVLQIVMDTIIRLTGAERGFLMLRDERGEMTNRIARNWEQEAVNHNEFAISRTVIQRVGPTSRRPSTPTPRPATSSSWR